MFRMPWNVRIEWQLLAQWTLQNNSLVFLFCNWINCFTEWDTSTNSDYVLYTCALNTVSTIPKICCYSWNYSGTSHKRLLLKSDYGRWSLREVPLYYQNISQLCFLLPWLDNELQNKMSSYSMCNETAQEQQKNIV